MSDYLELQDRISLAVKVGESQFREFKSALEGEPGKKVPRKAVDLARDIARTLVAFANADGGELLIGVEDDGSITGVPHNQKDVKSLLAAPETHVFADTPLPPSPRRGSTSIDGKVVLYFYVPKGTDFVYLTADGRCIKRIDRDSVPISSEQIVAQRLEEQSRNWDRTFVPGATLADLDIDLLNSVASQIAYGVSAERCLQYLDLAEFSPDGLRIKNAGLILFAKDVRRWHPRCQVRIMTFRGQERLSGADDFNVVRDEVVYGNLLQLVDNAWERLTVSLSQSTRLVTSSARFEQTLLYPQIACREALINALVHRNYAIEGRGIEISLFSDRLEIVSPGMLLSTVTLDELRQLKGAHESRNPLIARVLREVGLVREMGEGLKRIYEVMKSSALAEPILENSASGFVVKLSNRSLYSEEIRLWLSNFDSYHLSDAQRGILALGYRGQEFSTQDVIDRLGIVDMDKVRELMTPLRQAGLVERSLTDARMMAQARMRGIPKRAVPGWRVVGDISATKAKASNITLATDGDEIPEISAKDDLEIYISNIPYSADAGQITEFLSDVCEVIAVAIPGRPLAGYLNCGYAFVTVRVPGGGGLDALLKPLNGKIFGGRRIIAQKPRRQA